MKLHLLRPDSTRCASFEIRALNYPHNDLDHYNIKYT